ncbi:aspartyl-phosphate phosphatase Spo0E family protein [Bacillus sp. JJ1562]|uniref:aspartyl-phosphate phosphatase Spo0E family protein n=1 Tax=Bacillus sp. JJ1562 TaxID=3122960 RepID=UPI003002196B
MNTKQELTKNMEYLRKQMVELGTKTGFSSPATVQKSQELDRLLMIFLKGNNSSS